MRFEVAIVIAIFILTTTLVALMALISSRRRAAKEEELRHAASTRGWKFESVLERGYRVHRWSGTTEGVAWRAESLRRAARGNRRRRPQVSRWHCDVAPGVDAPVVCMGVPKGNELHSVKLAEDDGMLGKLAQKAMGLAFDKAIDVYFGSELGERVDAGAMHRVETALPGFIVMAANKDAGARLLAQGLEQTLTAATGDLQSALSDEDRPWILFTSRGISLARMEPLRDVAEIERIVRTGIALTRISRFARPFA